ncbi:hypothetical protein EGW08_019940 [Elysia chlorotica]|uniref:Menin n=1 Tax=Elysia chlorotica TaxID=188477 RepID=A0A433SSP2_ELYCH|nr:hypothetical protein EGW08_019940 [Elysia chlorotica]
MPSPITRDVSWLAKHRYTCLIRIELRLDAGADSPTYRDGGGEKELAQVVEHWSIYGPISSPGLFNVTAQVSSPYLVYGRTFARVARRCIENALTMNRAIPAAEESALLRPIFPVVDLETVEALYAKFETLVRGSIDLTQYESKFSSRELVKKISDVVWSSLSRSFKDKAHLQSLYSFLTAHWAILSVFAPTLSSSAEMKDEFYEELEVTSERLYLHKDFSAWVGANHDSWPRCISHFGVGKLIKNGQRLLELCPLYDLCITNTTPSRKGGSDKRWGHTREVIYNSVVDAFGKKKKNPGWCEAGITILEPAISPKRATLLE